MLGSRSRAPSQRVITQVSIHWHHPVSLQPLCFPLLVQYSIHDRRCSASDRPCVRSFAQMVGSHTWFYFIVSLGPHPWHMDVPRLRAESELQLPAYTTATALGGGGGGIRAMFATYTAADSNTGSLTHWSRPGIRTRILLDTSWVLNPLSHNRNSLPKSSEHV